MECRGRRELLWELSRERDREKKDVGDIVFWLSFIYGAHMVLCVFDRLKSGSIHISMKGDVEVWNEEREAFWWAHMVENE